MNAECALPSQIGVDRLPCHATVGGPVQERGTWWGADPPSGGEHQAGPESVHPDPGNRGAGGADRPPFIGWRRQASAENAVSPGPRAELVGGRGERTYDGPLKTE